MTADLILITGFLGSGKTTLLKNLLKFHKDKKIAVIQNEFSPSGVDGKELKLGNTNFELVEINNGSVFCVCLLSNFVENLNDLIDRYQPEIIYLEASGLSDPISICELLAHEQVADKVSYKGAWCVVDALNYEKSAALVNRAKHQIRIADKIILNKTDLIDANRIPILEDSLQRINPIAPIEYRQYCQIENADVNQITSLPDAKAEDKPPQEIKTAIYRTTAIIPPQKLEEFLIELCKISIRAKGFVRVSQQEYRLFHLSFNSFEIINLEDYTGSCEITAFGEHMTLRLLRNTFQNARNLVM